MVPNDNFDLLSSHVLPALIRKFHLAKLAAQGDLEGLDRDEALFGPIPPELKGSLGIPSFKSKIENPKSEIPTDPPHAARSVTIWGSGSPRREFLHVDDLADACLYLMDHYSEDPHINIGAGEDCTIRELAEMVREVVYPEAALVFDAGKPDGTPQKLLDVHRLHRMGWKHRINLKDGISDTYTWYLQQGKGNQTP